MFSTAFRNALGLTKPPKPTLFHTHEAFQAALRGHSQAQSCFAWGRYELKETLFYQVEWPLSRQNSERLEIIINDINIHFHRTPAY